MLNWNMIDDIILNGIKEDINNIDITTDNLIDDNTTIKGALIAKADGVIAGIPIFKRVFSIFDSSIEIVEYIEEGQHVTKGTEILEIKGRAKPILKGERLALNLLQRMSAIATLSYEYHQRVKDYDVRVVDTRKTTPGLRILEKYAVKIGGCHNHRYNLSDGVMIKDNHIKSVGGIKEAILRAKHSIAHTVKIEIEVENIEELLVAIEAGADIIMLDNMDMGSMKKAVEIAGSKVILEASGNITLDRVVEVANTGVDIISVGELTHSTKSLDISLKFY